MKSTVLIAALVASGNVAAAGFAPWDDRNVVEDTRIEASAAVETSGFAPWDKREVASEPNVDAVAGKAPASGFRPWS